MPCCPGKQAETDVLNTSGYLGSTFTESLASAGVQPVVKSTRDAEKNEVLQQRQQSMRMSVSGEAAANTRFALTSTPPRPLSHRMSRLGTMVRGNLVKNLEKMSQEPQLLQQPSLGTARGLTQRLASLGLASVEMEGDGNCQFRSIADQLFGSQEHHLVVRSVAMAHMRDVAADFFGMYFESPREYAAYLTDMSRSRTWGDELTLRACVEAFGCIAHVVTSEHANWYLVYQPETLPDARALAELCAKKGLVPPRAKKEIFVSYISPIHYNAVAAAARGI